MSDKNLSIINLDGASEIVIKFLDMIQNAIGWMVTPHGVGKDFEEALEMYKKSIEKDEKIDGIVKAARISSARKELKQYINQGKIIAYTIPDLNQNARLEVEDDWLSYFFNYAQNVSDESVQKIWARILAEHCNGDTSVKRMLIHTLSLLDAESAKAFGNLCKITLHCPYKPSIQLGSKYVSQHIPLVLSHLIYGLYYNLPNDDETCKAINKYSKCIPSSNDLDALQIIGLIELPEKRGMEFEFPYSFETIHFNRENNSRMKEFIIEHGSNKYIIEPIDKNVEVMYRFGKEENIPKRIKFGNVRFSTMGETLYKILNVEELDDFEYILKLCVELQGFYLKNF